MQPKASSCATITSPQVDLQFGSSQAPDDEFAVALVNSFLAVKRTYEWFTTLNPGSTALDDPEFDVGANATSIPGNAGYLQNGTIRRGIVFSKAAVSTAGDRPGSFNNMAFGTVVSHEFGHSIPDAIAVVKGRPLFGVGAPWHEGTADVIAAFTWDTPIMYEGQYNDPNILPENNFQRRLDIPDVRLSEPDTLPDWCRFEFSIYAPHCDALSLSGAFWDLRKSLEKLPRTGSSWTLVDHRRRHEWGRWMKCLPRTMTMTATFSTARRIAPRS